MVIIDESIDAERPVGLVYDHWTQFDLLGAITPEGDGLENQAVTEITPDRNLNSTNQH